VRLLTLIAFALVVVAPLRAQRDDAKDVRFDVASIRETTAPDDVRARQLPCALPPVERSGSRIRVHLTQLCGLIRVAYEVGEYQVARIPDNQGIGASNFFEVDALVESTAAPSMEDTRLMLRALLAERFQLQVRREPSAP